MDKLGPYELNEIYCGECSRMLAALPDGCIDLTVTSPPYDNLRTYNGYTFAFEPIARELYRVTKPGGVVVWVVGDETKDGSESFNSLRQALYFRDVCGFKAHDTMIWGKNVMPLNHDRYEQSFDYMFVFSKGNPVKANLLTQPVSDWIKERRKSKHVSTMHRYKDGQYKTASLKASKERVKDNIWYIKVGYSTTKDKFAFDHPAIFPEALARNHILSWSNPGDIVLDPMVGSGTTAKMAYQLHRRYLGFDISQEYVDLARRRVAMADTPLPLVEAEQPESPEQLALLEDKN